MVQKKYITYNRFWASPHHALDPDMQVQKLWPPVTFTELNYGGTSSDNRLLAKIEYADGALSTEAWSRFKQGFSHFCFYEVTAQVACDLCNEWYGAGSFTLDQDGFTLIDNRP